MLKLEFVALSGTLLNWFHNHNIYDFIISSYKAYFALNT